MTPVGHTFQATVSKTGPFRRRPWNGYWPSDHTHVGTASFFLVQEDEDHAYYFETGNDLEVTMDVPPAGFLFPGLHHGEWCWTEESGRRILYGSKEKVIASIVHGFFNQFDDTDPEDEDAFGRFLRSTLL